MSDLPTDQKSVREIVSIAKRAGDSIRSIFRGSYDIHKKSDQSPLTTADLASHEIITEGLLGLGANLPVLSEESEDIPFSTRQLWETYWLTDPLDGTRQFIKGKPEFTVNIALVSNTSAILGVIYLPMQDTTYYAVQGQGAFRIIGDQASQMIQVCGQVPDTPRICGNQDHVGKSLKKLLERLNQYELLSMGSSIKSCMVAEGSADLYPRYGPTSEWDTAAAQCVVEEAGGRFTDLSMNRLRYNTKESLLNPSFVVFGDNNFGWEKYL